MRMIITPVSASPAMIARWMGAAPRQRGSSEAWMFQHPSRGASSTGLRQDQAIGNDDGDIGIERGKAGLLVRVL